MTVLRSLYSKLDWKVIFVTGMAAGAILVGTMFLNAALGGPGVGCAEAAGDQCGQDIRNYPPKDVEIVSDTLSYTNALLLLKPQACSNDNLSTITAAVQGDIVILALDHNACSPIKTVTLINNGSSLINGFSLSGSQNFTLDSIYDQIMLMKRLGSDFWVEVSRVDDVGQLVYLSFENYIKDPPFSVNGDIVAIGSAPNNIKIRTWVQGIYVGNTNDSSNYWTVRLLRQDGGIGTVISSFLTKDLGGANTWLEKITTLNVTVPAGDDIIYVDLLKTGTPGSIYFAAPQVGVFLGN